MKQYYISLRPFTDGNHIIHKHDCPFLLEYRKYILLGAYESKEEAMHEGRKYFRKLALCRFCFHEVKGSRKSVQTSEIKARKGFITSRHLKSAYKNMMFISPC